MTALSKSPRACSYHKMNYISRNNGGESHVYYGYATGRVWTSMNKYCWKSTMSCSSNPVASHPQKTASICARTHRLQSTSFVCNAAVCSCQWRVADGSRETATYRHRYGSPFSQMPQGCAVLCMGNGTQMGYKGHNVLEPTE